MNECEKIAPYISEYIDGSLSPQEMWKVKSHISKCLPCAKKAGDFDTVRRLLREMPKLETSAQFDDKLFQKLAELPQTDKKPGLSFRGVWSDLWFAHRGGLQRGLAFAVGCLAVGGLTIFANLNTRHSGEKADTALLNLCVEQHRIDSAAQPLSDPSAQNLAAGQDAQNEQADALTNAQESY
jgi:hypothetical protein